MSNLALVEAQHELDAMHQRFNALAAVAGRNMPKVYHRYFAVPLTVGVATAAAWSEATYGKRGTIVNAVLAGAGYIAGMLAGENADLREIAYTFATGCGSAAAAIGMYDYKTSRMAATTAPAPVAQAA